MSVFRVNIVTPNGLVYDHNANMVVAKTLDGEIGILPQHAPIIVPLQINEVRVKRTDNPEHEDAVAVNGGVMEVRDNICTIIADSAERERDIDLVVLNVRKNVQRNRLKKRKSMKIVMKSTALLLLYTKQLTGYLFQDMVDKKFVEPFSSDKKIGKIDETICPLEFLSFSRRHSFQRNWPR